MISGWKTLSAGATLILTGLVEIISGLSGLPETIDWEAIKEGATLFGSGLAAIGIGHKVDKSGIVNVK